MSKIVRSALLAMLFLYAPLSVSAQVELLRINEVKPSENSVELFNSGNVTIDVSNLFFCNRPSYRRIIDTNLVSGSLNLAPGEYVVVNWSGFSASDGEIGLYREDTSDFGTAASMIDYVEYTSSGHGRESVAVANGFWEAGQTVPLPDAAKSISRVDASLFGSANWSITEPSLGSENLVATAIETPINLANSLELGSAFPNPFQTTSEFSISVEQAQHVRLVLFDTIGREVAILFNGVLPGNQMRTIKIEDAGLPNGMYWFGAVGTNFRKVRSVVLAR